MTPRTDHAGAFERQFRTLREAFAQEFPASDQEVIFGGKKMTLAEVGNLLRRVEDSFSAVHGAAQQLRQAVAARRKAMKQHRSTHADAVLFLKHHLGKDNPRLAQFGVPSPKPRTPLTADELAVARARAAATRRARGTMGRRQRLAQERAAGPTVHVFGADGKPLQGGAEGSSLEAEPNGHR